MKLFFINATCGYGSTGILCEDLMDYAAAQGDDCILAYGNGSSSDARAFRMTGQLSVRLHSLLSRVTGLQGYYSAGATGRLLRRLEQEKPDLVHLHNLHGNYVHIPMLLGYLQEHHIPTVLTLHDCHPFTGKCTHYTQAGCTRWQQGCGSCPQLRGDIPSWFFDFTGKMLADKKKIYESFPQLQVIAVSRWMEQQAGQSVLQHNKIRRIYNWVDTESFYPMNLPEENRLLVLGISTAWKKNTPKLQDFLKLSRCLPRGGQILLVGKMDKGVSLPSNIRHMPYVSDAEKLSGLFNRATAYVHLSYEESFGRVLAEAMACGTPVVAYGATACPELVGPGCGCVVAPGDVDAVAAALAEIQKNGKSFYRASCLKNAEKFRKEILLKKTYQLYQSMVSAPE